MCDWNPAALRDVFMWGLAGYIKDELVAYELPSTLEGLIELAWASRLAGGRDT